MENWRWTIRWKTKKIKECEEGGWWWVERGRISLYDVGSIWDGLCRDAVYRDVLRELIETARRFVL